MPASRAQRAVLGIDAAWTARAPSGVALAVEREDGWACPALAPSAAEFVRLCDGVPVRWEDPGARSRGVDGRQLLAAVARLAPRADVRAVAVDMPLSRLRIAGRRSCDDAVARAFGARGCGVHTASEIRPGRVGESLQRSFEREGYALATAGAPRRGRHLLEVFPHTALLALTGSDYRLEYKESRSARYWPEATPVERRARLLSEWSRVLAALRRIVGGIDLPLPAEPPARARMKQYEDALDALVCAWVAIEFLAGRAVAYGAADAAIWTPRAGARPSARRR